MKKMTGAVLSLAFLLGLACQASAIEHSKRQSLELKGVSGRTQETISMGGAVQSQDRVSVSGLDLNWMFHKRLLGLSWGLVARQRTMNTPARKLNFAGVGGSVGYLSNTFEDNRRWPVGWHTNFSMAFGKTSQVSDAYNQNSLSALGSWDFGLDFKLHGWNAPEPGKCKSALVLSLDYGAESQLAYLSTKTNPAKVGGMVTRGWIPKAGLSYYW